MIIRKWQNHLLGYNIYSTLAYLVRFVSIRFPRTFAMAVTKQKLATRRIFVSMPADEWLAPNQNDLKWGIVKEIERLGYTPEIFLDPRGKAGLAAGKAWSAAEADKVIRHCVGVATIGLPRWVFSTGQGTISLATEFCHYGNCE
jgi:hypothetical protein